MSYFAELLVGFNDLSSDMISSFRQLREKDKVKAHFTCGMMFSTFRFLILKASHEFQLQLEREESDLIQKIKRLKEVEVNTAIS
jgi:hypothetical protein